jgi:hypothetical protein
MEEVAISVLETTADHRALAGQTQKHGQHGQLRAGSGAELKPRLLYFSDRHVELSNCAL